MHSEYLLNGSGAGISSSLDDEDLGRDVLEPIAVIGYSFKFPQDATTPKGFWDMLEHGRCASTEFPSDRINAKAFFHPDYSRRDAFHFKGGHFLKEDLGSFDAPFFSIRPAEAEAMDPHQRKLLEVSYRALENAGLPIEKVAGTQTSVYTASFADDYRLMTHRDAERIPTYALTGTTGSFLANRLSWFYDLKGASLNVDTACSSSLVAVDHACQSLQNGSSSMSIVTGGNFILDPGNMIALSNLNFLSPDSRCFSFDSRANGYAQGEGVGVVILQRLSDAIRDGNTIRAVIRSTGSNSDGKTASISQPSPIAQERLIRGTYRKAGLSLRHTRYFEAHATGTAQGDPIEATAIGNAFSGQRKDESPLFVGAVKSNIGHLEGGSGLAGLIKTIMVLERGEIPPNANFENLNPKIDTKALQLKFPEKILPWPSGEIRRASINSFGFGGTNGHVVIEDAYNYLRLRHLNGRHCTKAVPSTLNQVNGMSVINGVSKNGIYTNGAATNGNSVHEVSSSTPKLLVWSAGDRDGINRLLETHSDHFRTLTTEQKSESYLADLAHTLGERRSTLLWRSFSSIKSGSDLDEVDGSVNPPTKPTMDPKLAFAFTGQGAQWPRMGLELLAYPVFRRSVEDADAYLRSLGCEWSLIEELGKDGAESSIQKPGLSQPLCTVLQVALVDLLRTFGIMPSAVVGHSSGEIAAAYATGAISARSAWRISYYRGLMAEMLATAGDNQGGMLSAGVSPEQARPYLKRLQADFGKCHVVVACINSPTNVTLSGDKKQLAVIAKQLEGSGIFNRMLRVDVGYHSPQMVQIADEYLESIESLEAGSPPPKPCYMISSLKGKMVHNDELINPQYWVENMTMPVKFAEAVQLLVQPPHVAVNGYSEALQVDNQPVNCILEVGPHAALQGPIKDSVKAVKGSNSSSVDYAATLRRSASDLSALIDSVGKLWCWGHSIDLAIVNGTANGKHTAQLLVDLPAYSFDMSRTFWPESHIMAGHQFRGDPRDDLLGTRVPDWNPLDAKWLNRIKVEEIGWVAHHVVNGAILYPGAGMIVMAIEAMKQTLGDEPIKGFELRNVLFQKGIYIPQNSPGVEVSFTLRRLKARRSKFSNWSEWILSMYDDGKWVENCRGTIKAERFPDANIYGNSQEIALELEEYRRRLQAASGSCNTPLSSREVYECFESCGLEYGPTFQLLEDTYSDNGDNAVSRVQLLREPWDDKLRLEPSYAIHPTTLDAFFHLLYVGLTEGCVKTIPTSVPTRIQKLWISNGGLRHPQGKEVVAHSQRMRLSPLLERTSLFALDPVDGALRLLADGVETQAVANVDSLNKAADGDIQRFHRLEWKPDMTLMDNSQVKAYLQGGIVNPEGRETFYDNLTLLLLMFINDALEEISEEELAGYSRSKQKYHAWMRNTMNDFENGVLPNALLSWKEKFHDTLLREQLCDEVGKESAQGKLFVETAINLLDILRGKVNIHELYFQGSLAEDFYSGMYSVPRLKKAYVKYLDTLAHKRPMMRILEIGAGTGGATVSTFEGLTSESGAAPRYQHYEFTDVSPSFFERAKNRFPEQVSRMKFKMFDVGEDPIPQGFEAGSYDMVLAFGSIHITKDLAASTRNARKLLKPGGKLIIGEITREDILRSSFAFGLFPDWWLSLESFREWGPSVSEARWDDLLTQNGFSGIDLILHDYEEDNCQEVSIMVATAAEETTRSSESDIVIVADRDSPSQMDIATRLDQLLTLEGYAIQIVQMEDIGPTSTSHEKPYIFFTEYDRPMLHDLNAESYENVKSTFIALRNAIWVTGGGGMKPTHPGFGAIDGFARSLRNENGSLTLSSLALDRTHDNKDKQIGHIRHLLETKIMTSSQLDQDQEYYEYDELPGINRLVIADQVQKSLVTNLEERTASMELIGQCPPMKLAIHSPGLLSTLEFVEDKSLSGDISTDEIEIQVRAVGITVVDCLAAMGRYREGWMGGECAGTVLKAGGNSGFQPGDSVAFVGLDGFATRTRSRTAVKIPNGLSFAEAATIPVSFTLAHFAVVETARVRPGESVLITHGACGVGQACIQVARRSGAEVFITVNSAAEKEALLNTFDIAADQILSHEDLFFVKAVQRHTDGRGVDVILNALDEDGSTAAWDCMAPFGRFVEVGPDAKLDERRLRLPPQSSISYSTTNLRTLMNYRPGFAKQMLADIMALVAAGQYKVPKMLYTYTASDVESAFRELLDRQNAGKAVVTLEDDTVVKCVLDRRETYAFDKDATYVLSGGLGTCGRMIAEWMVGKGVRSLLLLSRSGEKAAPAFIESLRQSGARIEAPSCDVCDRTALEDTLSSLQPKLPPIKGCVQGAVVIRDSVLEKMPFEDWEAVTGPKIRGTQNLHDLLPRNLDFFIMLSSMAGPVGFSTQTNYSAGNTYQDALSRYRRANGENAVSINLGPIDFDSPYSRDPVVREIIFRSGIHILQSEVKLCEMIEYFCSPRPDPQVLLGINDPAPIRSRHSKEPPSWMFAPLFSHFHTRGIAGESAAGGAVEQEDIVGGLAGALSDEEAGAIVASALIRRLASILSIDAENIDEGRPMHAYGVDSLVAVDIRNWIAREMKADVAIFDILGAASLKSTSVLVGSRSKYRAAK